MYLFTLGGLHCCVFPHKEIYMMMISFGFLLLALILGTKGQIMLFCGYILSKQYFWAIPGLFFFIFVFSIQLTVGKQLNV